jgi:DNA-binding GntR family transcriptional regulator
VAGERLVEDKLAEQLGVSRNPVREAIQALHSTGLIEVVPRHGAHVASVNPQDAIQIQEIRRELEIWIVGAAAERHDASDLAELDRCLAKGAEASANGDRAAAAEAHRDFHIALEAATKNKYASVVMNPLRQLTELVFSVVGDSTRGAHWGEHQAIRDAIANRDREKSQELIDAHIAQALERFSEKTSAAE